MKALEDYMNEPSGAFGAVTSVLILTIPIFLDIMNSRKIGIKIWMFEYTMERWKITWWYWRTLCWTGKSLA